MKKYDFRRIEKKWQKKWRKLDLYKAEDFSEKPKQYILVEFPYPSGDGLHVGHARSYSALDAVARKRRMEGYNVLYPMGWDAFGLPTENYAIKTGIHPRKATDENIKRYKKQIESLGLSFDWSREIDTTDPEYYKWTQWIFLKFFEHGLAYQAEMPINWCPSCKIGLANEEAIGGACERCGVGTEKRNIKQWLLKITEYADSLIDDLDTVDYPDRVKAQQIHWIGRSFGTDIDFEINGTNERLRVFTTRADTIFGVTAIVCAPENKLISNLKSLPGQQAGQISNLGEVEKYVTKTAKKSDIDRISDEKERTGVELEGIKAVHPMTGGSIPVWVADYVIPTYGGGVVMMVPAHDRRDFSFAKAHGIEIREVVSGGDVNKEAYVEYGTLVNSGEFSGLSSEDAIQKITEWLRKKNLGGPKKNYKLRDWIFSRQHYWGEPIPIIHCEKCGPVAVPEKDLPVELPYVEKYEPTQTGESPLANISEWVKTKCPKCGGSGRRETDTMPNWAGSNWYYLAYIMQGISNFKFPPTKSRVLDKVGTISKYEKSLKYWIPVDWYNGGMEHTTLHLLYSRFVYKFLYDIGAVPKECGPEPYKKRTSHGMVLAEDNQKMSKSRGNVISPDDVVGKFGVDSLRMYEMFMGPFDQTISWSTNGLVGCFRFLNRVWNFFQDESNLGDSDRETKIKLNQLVKKISEDIDAMKFNTAIATCMEFMNFCSGRKLSDEDASVFLRLISPITPHISEEIWNLRGNKQSIFMEPWPEYDVKFILEETFKLILQVNGKVRDEVVVKLGVSENEAKDAALKSEKVQKYVGGKNIKKIIYVPGRLINIVV